MKEKEQHQIDPHLDSPSEANHDKHINFRKEEEESAENFMINKSTSDRQKQWQQEIKEDEEEKSRSDLQNDNSAIPLDNDDTIGIP